jgi:hypothetical protein
MSNNPGKIKRWNPSVIITGLLIGSILTIAGCRSGDQATVDAPASPANTTTDSAASPATSPAATTNAYPEAEITAYMTSCTQSAQNSGATAEQAQQYCRCTIDKIQQQYTYDEFVKVVQEMQAAGGNFPAPIQEIIASCQPTQ